MFKCFYYKVWLGFMTDYHLVKREGKEKSELE